MNCISEFTSVMKGYFKKFAKAESHKMRDVAIDPITPVLFAIPWLLIAIVVMLAVFAVIKVVKISRARNAAADGSEDSDDEK